MQYTSMNKDIRGFSRRHPFTIDLGAKQPKPN